MQLEALGLSSYQCKGSVRIKAGRLFIHVAPSSLLIGKMNSHDSIRICTAITNGGPSTIYSMYASEESTSDHPEPYSTFARLSMPIFAESARKRTGFRAATNVAQASCSSMRHALPSGSIHESEKSFSSISEVDMQSSRTHLKHKPTKAQSIRSARGWSSIPL